MPAVMIDYLQSPAYGSDRKQFHDLLRQTPQIGMDTFRTLHCNNDPSRYAFIAELSLYVAEGEAPVFALYNAGLLGLLMDLVLDIDKSIFIPRPKIDVCSWFCKVKAFTDILL